VHIHARLDAERLLAVLLIPAVSGGAAVYDITRYGARAYRSSNNAAANLGLPNRWSSRKYKWRPGNRAISANASSTS
jgi:hypothetical protein